jgi:hypothetical protein
MDEPLMADGIVKNFHVTAFSLKNHQVHEIHLAGAIKPYKWRGIIYAQ